MTTLTKAEIKATQKTLATAIKQTNANIKVFSDSIKALRPVAKEVDTGVKVKGKSPVANYNEASAKAIAAATDALAKAKETLKALTADAKALAKTAKAAETAKPAAKPAAKATKAAKATETVKPAAKAGKDEKVVKAPAAQKPVKAPKVTKAAATAAAETPVKAPRAKKALTPEI